MRDTQEILLHNDIWIDIKIIVKTLFLSHKVMGEKLNKNSYLKK